jgi:hypothetical protein
MDINIRFVCFGVEYIYIYIYFLFTLLSLIICITVYMVLLQYLTGLVIWPSINGHFWGPFFGGVSPSKNGLSNPSLEGAQLCSKARVFLLSENKRRLLCMGRTYAAKRWTLLQN